MKTKKHNLIICMAIAAFTLSTIAEGALIVDPVSPTIDDSVSITWSTWLSNPGVLVTGSSSSRSGYDIFLDLHTYQQPGIWPYVLVLYEEPFHLGILPAGTYNVEATQHFTDDYDTCEFIETTTFEVIPEPGPVALLIFGTGAIYLKRRLLC